MPSSDEGIFASEDPRPHKSPPIEDRVYEITEQTGMNPARLSALSFLPILQLSCDYWVPNLAYLLLGLASFCLLDLQLLLKKKVEEPALWNCTVSEPTWFCLFETRIRALSTLRG